MTDDLERCLRTAVGKLKRSVLSESQLRAKLFTAGYDEAVIASTLATLRSRGAVNDEALGRALLAELRRRKGAGPRMLAAKLHSKGLDESLIERLLAEPAEDDAGQAVEPASEADQAEALARESLSTLGGNPASRWRKLAALLIRRGYSEDAVTAALERLGYDSGQDEDPEGA